MLLVWGSNTKVSEACEYVFLMGSTLLTCGTFNLLRYFETIDAKRVIRSVYTMSLVSLWVLMLLLMLINQTPKAVSAVLCVILFAITCPTLYIRQETNNGV